MASGTQNSVHTPVKTTEDTQRLCQAQVDIRVTDTFASYGSVYPSVRERERVERVYVCVLVCIV